jgi:asparagine synthase (glutamine-hydrolysing)
MCGICGFVEGHRPRPGSDCQALVEAMAETLFPRGPDGGGHWTDPAAGVALGHRRLAIIDVSDQGHQPMVSADGRVVVSFNGEIYNYRVLRAELESAGRRFRGGSDTEVLVEALALWGAEATLRRLLGIFAFAAWETRERRLTLARDHLGVKPLYWGRRGSGLMFGSELKALRALPGWEPEIDRGALTAFVRFGQVPGPLSIYRGVHQLPPGTLLTWDAASGPRQRRFYDLSAVARAGLAQPLDLPEDEAADRLEALLDQVIAGQMIADVPLGAFLSGGIDSSTVVALMQRRADRPVRTFCIGFRHGDYDEAEHAAAVARHLGTEHTELYVGEPDLLDLVPRLAEVYDEPFADASQLPTLLVCALARRQVTVALSGDGGDELFAGYNRHLWAGRLWRRAAGYPAWLRHLVAGAVTRMPPRVWHGLASAIPQRHRPRQLGDKLDKAARLIAEPDLAAGYAAVRSAWPQARALVLGAPDAPSPTPLAEGLDPVSALQLADALAYLPDDILTKVDRASMSLGLEARVPLLDPRVAAFAWRLPARLKVRGGTGKWLLRQVLYRHVPKALVERPKSGFSVPLDAWLRGPLKAMAADLLAPRRLAGQGLLDPGPITALWNAHQGGRVDAGQRLWHILALQLWLERWR